MSITGYNLPPEVWTRVLDEVPQPQLAMLLGVCSQFHDIVIRSIFSSIKIYFMGGERAKKMLNHYGTPWVEEVSMSLMSKSWEMLNHICQDRSFARVVKSVTVIAFGDNVSFFERMTLARTLPFIPNLQTFRWIGAGPAFDISMAECLPVTLKKLSIQSPLPSISFAHLPNIRHLELTMPFFSPDDEEAHYHLVVDNELETPPFPAMTVGELLQGFSSELHSLRICAIHIQDIPVRTCNTLTSLDLLMTIGDEKELIGLDAIFRHASLLESLSIVGFIHPLIFSFLENAAAAMPLLTSFRLSDDEATECHHAEVDAITNFLRDRPLRRLFLRIGSFRNIHNLAFLPIITSNQSLDVLGLYTGINAKAEEVETIMCHLPPRLRALHLALDWDGSDMLQLVDQIGRLSKLSFLHLYGVVTRLPVLLDDLANEAKGLQMVGLNRSLWNINRVGDEIFFDKLPRWRIKFAVDEDFLCDDDAWLFKYN